MKTIYACPKCSSENLIQEKRIDGDSTCIDCRYKGKSTEFFVDKGEANMANNRKLNGALNDFSAQMRLRLEEKVKEGYTGWDDPNHFDAMKGRLFDKAADIISGTYSESHLIDIANYAMFLRWQLIDKSKLR